MCYKTEKACCSPNTPDQTEHCHPCRSAMAKTHYPNRARVSLVVNAPWWFSRLFALVRPLLAPAVAEQTHVFTTADQEKMKAVLFRFVEPGNVPPRYGGTSAVSIGASEAERVFTDLCGGVGVMPQKCTRCTRAASAARMRLPVLCAERTLSSTMCSVKRATPIASTSARVRSWLRSQSARCAFRSRCKKQTDWATVASRPCFSALAPVCI